MHSSEVKEDTHDSFRRITAEVICAGENELRVRVATPSLPVSYTHLTLPTIA